MKLHTGLDRRLVPAGEQSERYLRISITAPDQTGPNKRLPLNLALVIDRSGSMAGSKLEKAKEAAILCLRNLTGADRAAVIAYDDEVRVVSSSRALTPIVKNELISEIRTIYPGGSTNLGGGWLTGAQQVADHMHQANYLNRVILLSDGLANVGIVDPDELAHHAEELRLRGVSTSTMGIGADFNEDLMEQIAIKGGGHFYFIEHAQQIPDFLHRELGEVLSTCARHVTLQLVPFVGMRVEMLNNYETDRTDGAIRVRLDDMITGEVRSLVFKLTISNAAVGTTLPCAVELTYTDVDSGEVRTVRSDEASLRVVAPDEAAAEQPDISVLEDAALLQAARAREEALHFDAQGNYAASATSLADAAQALMAMAPPTPTVMADIEALQKESEQAQHGLDSMARKSMHYQKFLRQRGRKE
jgi:Ca-activated chloride channel family protein